MEGIMLKSLLKNNDILCLKNGMVMKLVQTDFFAREDDECKEYLKEWYLVDIQGGENSCVIALDNYDNLLVCKKNRIQTNRR